MASETSSQRDWPSAGAPGRPRPFHRSGFPRSPAGKIILIGFVIVLLLVPSTFIWILVEERAQRAEQVADDIARSWGGTQAINGPYLVVPFVETRIAGIGDNRTEDISRRLAVLFAEKLDVTADTVVEERQKSIYRLPVYQSQLTLAGRFGPPAPGTFAAERGGTIRIEADKARLVVGIGDVRALKNEVFLTLNGAETLPFEPGLGPMRHAGDTIRQQPGWSPQSAGIQVPIQPDDWRTGFGFAIALKLNGSRALYVSPAGQTTKVALTSDWPHPGFTGAYLPDTRSISDTGFSADWSIPYLARGLPKVVQGDVLPLSDQMLGVKFVDPVKFYQTISRSLKYAIGFFSLTFLAVFVLEMRSGWSLHWIQYGLVGLALVVFYVMLLAFAEHIGYAGAYLVAALAATGLVAWYVGAALGSRMSGLVMFTVLGAVYGVLYAVMREQDYALLVGSVISFLSLAVTMYATRGIDWSGEGQPAETATTGLG